MWVEGWGDLPGQLVVVSGPSGCGKSSVIRRVLQSGALRLRLSVSATTREIRPGEQHLVDYEFMSRDHFIKMRDEQHEFIEWVEYNGNLYGTPWHSVRESLQEGQSVVLEIEVEGAKKVRDHAPAALFMF